MASTKDIGSHHLSDLDVCPTCSAATGDRCVNQKNGHDLRGYRIHNGRKARAPETEPPPFILPGQISGPSRAYIAAALTEGREALDAVSKAPPTPWHGLDADKDKGGPVKLRKAKRARGARALFDPPPPDEKRHSEILDSHRAGMGDVIALIASIRRDARDAERWRKRKARGKGGKT